MLVDVWYCESVHETEPLELKEEVSVWVAERLPVELGVIVALRVEVAVEVKVCDKVGETEPLKDNVDVSV